MKNYNDLSAKEIYSSIASKEFSCEEMITGFKDIIASLDEHNNSFVTTNFEKSIEQAKIIDKKIADNIPVGNLAGIPVAVSDNICTKGLKTTASSKMLENFVPPYNAFVVDKIYENDGIVIGKTAIDEFGMGSTGEYSDKNSVNPYNEKNITGGSASGSAVAVASKEVPVAINIDTAGDSRVPAALCGIIGFKPSYGTLSRYGMIPYAPTMDRISFMARTVEDIELVFKNVLGEDNRDVKCKHSSLSVNIEDIKKSKIALLKDSLIKCDSDVLNAIHSRIEIMKENGLLFDKVSIPSEGNALAAHYVITSSEAYSSMGRYDGVRFGYQTENKSNIDDLYTNSRSEAFGDEIKRRIITGTYFLNNENYSKYYKRARLLQEKLEGEYNEVFKKYDFIVCPVTSEPSFEKGKFDNDVLDRIKINQFTVSANLLGLPAISIPCGVDENNIPVSLQIIGKKYSDLDLLAIAKLFE